MPVMMGMMVCAVGVMCSFETHKIPLGGYLRLYTELPWPCQLMPRWGSGSVSLNLSDKL